MASLIQQLQSGASDSDFPVSQLLLKAKIVASKLDLQDFLVWIEKELSGYDTGDEVPEYRKVVGKIQGWNPYHGWQPVIFSDAEMQKMLSERQIGQPVGELYDLLSREGSGNLAVSFPAEFEQKLRAGLDVAPSEIRLFIDRSEAVGILDAVRNYILDRSLELEKAGVTGINGEELSFSPDDKEKARKAEVSYSIGKIENLVGNIGPMAEGATINIKQINQETIPELLGIIGQTIKHINSLGLVEEKKNELKDATQEIKAELTKEIVETSRVKRLLGSIKNIMEGVAGNVIAQGIIAGIVQYI